MKRTKQSTFAKRERQEQGAGFAPVIGVWLAVGVLGCIAYSLSAACRKRRA